MPPAVVPVSLLPFLASSTDFGAIEPLLPLLFGAECSWRVRREGRTQFFFKKISRFEMP